MKTLLEDFLALQTLGNSIKFGQFVKERNIHLDTINHPSFGKRIIVSNGKDKLSIGMELVLKGCANA